MGGMGGEVRGKTKIATWLEYRRMVKRVGLGLAVDFPRRKRDAYEEMKWDEVAEEWVLRYHFGK